MVTIINGDDPSCGIKKKVLFASRCDLPEYCNDTKASLFTNICCNLTEIGLCAFGKKFNRKRYQTRLCNDEQQVIDDNRNDPKPMEIIIGKKFKLEVWETCLKSMRPTEVASFVVDPSMVINYPLVAKSLREIRCGKHHVNRHCCGMTIKEIGLGFPDLDELLRDPQPLEFIFELLSVEEPGKYRKDLWALGDDERVSMIPQLKEEGNHLFVDKKYDEAADKYGQAIGLLEQLALREKPGDEEFVKFENMKIPFLLNYSQCKLFLKDYYAVIKQTSEVLEKEPDNVKALYRRGKAHIGAWNPDEARSDLNRAAEIDPSLTKSVQKELHALALMEREKLSKDSDMLKGKLFS